MRSSETGIVSSSSHFLMQLRVVNHLPFAAAKDKIRFLVLENAIFQHIALSTTVTVATVFFATIATPFLAEIALYAAIAFAASHVALVLFKHDLSQNFPDPIQEYVDKKMGVKDFIWLTLTNTKPLDYFLDVLGCIPLVNIGVGAVECSTSLVIMIYKLAKSHFKIQQLNRKLPNLMAEILSLREKTNHQKDRHQQLEETSELLKERNRMTEKQNQQTLNLDVGSEMSEMQQNQQISKIDGVLEEIEQTIVIAKELKSACQEHKIHGRKLKEKALEYKNIIKQSKKLIKLQNQEILKSTYYNKHLSLGIFRMFIPLSIGLSIINLSCHSYRYFKSKSTL